MATRGASMARRIYWDPDFQGNSILFWIHAEIYFVIWHGWILLNFEKSLNYLIISWGEQRFILLNQYYCQSRLYSIVNLTYMILQVKTKFNWLGRWSRDSSHYKHASTTFPSYMLAWLWVIHIWLHFALIILLHFSCFLTAKANISEYKLVQKSSYIYCLILLS